MQLYALLTEGFCSYRLLNTSNGARLFWIVKQEEETNLRCLLVVELNEDEVQEVRHHIFNKEKKGESVGSSLLEPVRRKMHKRRSYLAVMGPQVGIQARQFKIPKRGSEQNFIDRINTAVDEIVPR